MFIKYMYENFSLELDFAIWIVILQGMDPEIVKLTASTRLEMSRILAGSVWKFGREMTISRREIA